MDADDVLSDEERIAFQLEGEAPWDTVSSCLSHAGWVDLVTTIKQTCPKAYEEMRTHYLLPPRRT